MIINMRYYLVTITAIFLALGIGIFIGFTLDGQEIFVEQQQSLISDLELKFSELKGETVALQNLIDEKEAELLLYRDFINQVFPRLVEDKLQGFNVAIIESSDQSINTGLITSLKKAGANVSSVTFVKKDLIVAGEEKMQTVRERFPEAAEADNMQQYISSRLVNSILTGKDGEFVNFLKKLKLIEISGTYNKPVDYFILAGGSTLENAGDVTDIDIPMIEAIKNSNIPVIGVEKSDCEESYIEHYKKMRISTVDNIDTMIGQYSLIMILQGIEGHFGLKDTADALTPDDHSIR